jgi:F-type H+-transporting ATPase subunit epsilon
VITFELITPEGTRVAEEVYEVLIPTRDGEIGILPHHIPLVSIATTGVVSLRKTKETTIYEHIASSGGIIEINNNRVRLLADTAERAEDIDEMKAQEALKRAIETKKNAQDQGIICH